MNLDYSKLKYDPFDVPVGTMIWEHYKPLARRAHLSSVPDGLFMGRGENEIPKPRDLSLLISFVILLVDPGSPLYEDRDFDERVGAAMEVLRIERGSLVGKMILEHHWYFAHVLTAYFRIINNHTLESWIALKMNSHIQKAYLMAPIGKDDSMETRRKIQAALPESDKQIQALERQLFPDSSIKELVNDDVTSDSLVGPAERYAQTW